MAEPDKALAEAARVLKKDGEYAYTTWLPPQQGWDMFDLLVRAIQAHGTMNVDLPRCTAAVSVRGRGRGHRMCWLSSDLEGCLDRRKMALWTGSTGVELLDLIYKAIVRAPMLIEAQEPKAREAIKQAIISKAEAMETGGKITMRWPYLLVTARRS